MARIRGLSMSCRRILLAVAGGPCQAQDRAGAGGGQDQQGALSPVGVRVAVERNEDGEHACSQAVDRADPRGAGAVPSGCQQPAPARPFRLVGCCLPAAQPHDPD